MIAIPRDENTKVALFGVSSIDGETLVTVAINPENGKLQMEAVISETAIAQDAARESSTRDLITQIKIMNMHLSQITEQDYTEDDIEEVS